MGKDLNSDTINIIAVKNFIGLLYTQRTRLKEREERKHEQRDHEWECDLCQKQYGCIKELKEHEKKEHEWKCDECKNQYVCINELDKHLKKEHGVKKHGCKECRKRFESLEEAIVHMKNCFICDFCDYGSTESRKDFEFHMKRRHNKNCYTCEQCSNWYRSREDLDGHKRRRHSKECEKKFESLNKAIWCIMCRKTFESQEELRVHEENCESGWYKCKQCNIWCSSREDLEEHKREECKQCKQCNIWCSSREDLEEHKRE